MSLITSPAVQKLVIDGARRSDLTGIRWLLAVESLPNDDLTADSLDHFFVCRDDIGVLAVGGIEPVAGVALLRAIVVTNSYGGRVLGRRLVSATEERATELGLRAIYVVASAAELFFEQVGFRHTSAEKAPPELRAHRAFRAPRAVHAPLMVKP